MHFRQTIRLAAILLGFCLGLCGGLVAQIAPLAVVDEPLPPIEAGVPFQVSLHATGGVPPYVWSVASGDLPEGINLTPEGILGGRLIKPGAFAVTLKVEDSGRPAHTINKELRVVVAAALLLEWLQPPTVQDNRIDGSVQVSNGSTNGFDLTVIIVAVAENGRATALGYERMDLKPGTSNVKIPFGSALGYGPYVVHADAVAEIPSKNIILRQRLQTPQPLQIVQGP
jgi:hypothetical protein